MFTATLGNNCLIFSLTLGRPENVLSITSENINLGLFVNRHSAFSMLSEEGAT